MFRRKAKAKRGTPQLIRVVPRGNEDYERPLAHPRGRRPMSLHFDASPLTEDKRHGHRSSDPELVKGHPVETESARIDRLDVNGHPYLPRERQRSLSSSATTRPPETTSPRTRAVHRHNVKIVPLMKPVSPPREVISPLEPAKLTATMPSSSSRSPRMQNFYTPQSFHTPLSSHAPKLAEGEQKSKSFDVAVPQQKQVYRHHHNIPRDEVERKRDRQKNAPTPPPPYQSSSSKPASFPSPRLAGQSPSPSRPRHNIRIVPLMQPVDKTPTISSAKTTPTDSSRGKHPKIVTSKSLDFALSEKKQPHLPLSPDPGYSSPVWSEHPYKQPTTLGSPLGRAPLAIVDDHAPRSQRPASSSPLGRQAVVLKDKNAQKQAKKLPMDQRGGLGPAPVSRLI